MRKSKIFILVFMFSPLAAFAVGENVLKFNGTDYLHRWSQGTQHEFTPVDQPDLEEWEDMLTINYYPEIKDSEALAAIANKVLEIYEKYGAMVLLTDSVPPTSDKPAEYLIVVVFQKPSLIEFVQARLKLNDGAGASIVYSHRMYGSEIGEAMDNWMAENASNTEAALMSLNDIPSLGQLEKLGKK